MPTEDFRAKEYRMFGGKYVTRFAFIGHNACMSETIAFDTFEVSVVRSKRRKTAVIKVDLEGVSVRVPQSLATQRIQELILEKMPWVEKKLEEAEQKRTDLANQAEVRATLGQGSEILVQGKRLALLLLDKARMSVEVQGERLEVSGPSDVLNDPEELRALIEQWLYSRAVDELSYCVNVFKQKVGVSPKELQIKNYRARWGSCKPDGSIQLNWRLIHAPMHIMDYVVVHELCHLREMNHSKQFWSEVERIDPLYRMKRQWLKDNGYRLTL